jgi:hypothetical protein
MDQAAIAVVEEGFTRLFVHQIACLVKVRLITVCALLDMSVSEFHVGYSTAIPVL